MIFAGSKVKIVDNSGGKIINCIKTLKCSQRKGISALGIVVASIRKIKLNKNKIIKGKIFKAILIRSKRNFIRSNGFDVSFVSNAVILLNEKLQPIGSRIKGPVYKEFRSKYMSKVIILSNFSV